MAVRLSTGAANALLDTGIDTSFDSGTLRFYTGSQPASANDAPSGTLLVEMTLPADAFAAVGSRAMAKNGTWQDASGNADGTAGWFRLATSGDGGASSTTDIRIDGSITATGGGGDLTLDNTSIASAQSVTQSTFSISF